MRVARRSADRRAIAVALALGLAGCFGADDPEGSAPYLDLAVELARGSTSPEASPANPIADPERGFLFLPAGSRVEYPLYVETRSSLRADRIALRGRGSRLEVTLRTDADGEAELATLGKSKKGVAIPLENEERIPALLIFRAHAEDGEAQSGVLIEGPALWAPDTAAGPPSATPERPSRPVNVVIYLIDTLRRDRLGCYGYPKPITPEIDAFAARATLFVNAIGQSSWTKASVGSLFTGLWPPVHGGTGWKHSLDPGAETLAEVLRSHGYRTGALSTNPNVVKEFGFDRGFDDFFRHLKISSEEVNEKVFEWLDGQDGTRPFFLYVHTIDPHAPYAPPEPYRTRFAPDADQMPAWEPRWKWPLQALPFLSDLYEAEIAYNDASFGQFLQGLEARGLYDDSLVILLSDHGEEFKEHGKWRHGNDLRGVTLNFPLIVKFPGQEEGRAVETLAQHVDLMPTILAFLGLPVPDRAEGRNLSRLAGESAEDRLEGRVYSHLRLGKRPLTHSLVDGEWKLIQVKRQNGFSYSLYNWKDDPGEKDDRSAELPVRTSVLTALLERRIAGVGDRAAVEETVSDELIEELKSLGYLQ